MEWAQAWDERLASVLPSGSLFAVGGRVRDEIRAVLDGTNIPAKDLDYVVTGISLEDLQPCLRSLGRVDFVGAAFAVLKVTVSEQTVDVALPRRERSSGQGHREFDVHSGPDVSLEEDLARRDFRMNMIARALPSGDIVDPYGGADDIRNRRIDILTPASFDEDPLRMLRAAQFAARFAYAVTDSTRSAMAGAAAAVLSVSPERIYEEFAKLFANAAKPSIAFQLLKETGVLKFVWPELLEGVGVAQNEWHAYDVWRHNMETMDATPPGDVTLRIAALLHDVGKPRTKDGPHFYRHEIVGAKMAAEMLQRLRFPSDTVATVSHIVRHHMYNQDPNLSGAAVRRFIRRIGPEHLHRQFAVRVADIVGSGMPKRDDSNERFQARVSSEMDRQPPFSIADLAINGSDVMETMIAISVAPSSFTGDRRVGVILRRLFEQVTDSPERNTRETLLALAEEYLRTDFHSDTP
ncbi:MAG: HD domain-containing protein [Candidatus Eremiobacteraeota bacterium]|nr:HD domain-containing protein [Candidatus Eremiobacteraeota bacterium]